MFEKVFVITRKTRLAELVERFNTVGQARFYIEHAGGDFGEYEREDAVYHEVTRTLNLQPPNQFREDLLVGYVEDAVGGSEGAKEGG